MATSIIPELRSDPINAVKSGLPVRRFDEIQEMLDVPDERLLKILGISKSTLIRRRKRSVFTQAESEHLARLAQILDHAVEVLGDVDSARTWLTKSKLGLGWKVPLDHMETEQGAREVDDLLSRIKYGVAS